MDVSADLSATSAPAIDATNAPVSPSWTQRISDVFGLMKPRIALMVVITAAGGAWVAPGRMPWTTLFWSLFGTASLVSAANALNCYLERDSDKFMARTATRALPAGRLNPRVAVAVGVVLSLAGIGILATWVNALTMWLGVLALASYVVVYTPLKQKSDVALFVGAVPGALPPLMGWTTATNSIDAVGLALFGILFLWQIPHFIAIAIFRKSEYIRAGIKVLPAERGDQAARVHALVWVSALVPVSLLPAYYGVVGWAYAAVALVGGAAFVVATAMPLTIPWPRRVFFTSLGYLTAVFAALIIDAS